MLPYPPSVNGYWRTPRSGPIAGRTLISEAGRKYRAEIGALIAATRSAFGLTGRLRVEIAMHAPDKRQRDLDNITKSLLDALTHAGVWVDDSQIDDLRLRRERIIRGGQVVVSIEEIAPAVAQGSLLSC
ncbi:RusA family crossover junction endodeoxyribonuclease [Pigmentiphaga soli]|uniref:Crossover junction endodeoxyribonuclease RusA n=1 Tax=Pigmentiphaga soli TaxID=1007095 RepID=A0ABP8GD44_9BURK